MPPGFRRISTAFSYGVMCHIIFTLAVGAMIVAMFFGMSESLGRVPEPWSYVTNGVLALQFPIVHSLLLSARGSKLLKWFAPADYARTLSTTTYAMVASLQLLMLFALWTPSGVVWWRAEGTAFYVICALYTLSWLRVMMPGRRYSQAHLAGCRWLKTRSRSFPECRQRAFSGSSGSRFTSPLP